MAKEFIIIVKHKGDPDSKAWEEKLPTPEDADPKKYAEDMVKRFNEEEDWRKQQYPEYPASHRELVKVKIETDVHYCSFTHKVNLMSVLSERYGIYDVWQCERCKIYYKRNGIQELPERILCTPECLCRKCNRLFTSPAKLAAHMKIGKHRTPGWLSVTVDISRV